MAITIVATVGGSSSNSFVTLAEATTYHEGRLNATAFSGAATDDQNRAIVEATRELSSLSWQSVQVTSTQALAWPRFQVPNPDSTSAYSYYATTVIPQRVKDATCELALEFLKAGTTDLAAAIPDDGVIQKVVDVLSTTWAQPSQRRRGIARFPRVQRLLSPLLDGSSGQLRVVRG